MNTQPPSDRAERLFYQALDLSEEAAELFLVEECGDDRDLRAEVESLLRFHHHKDEQFLRDAVPLSPEVEAELARLKPEEAGDRIGYYKLLEQIGEGGFGKVWVAEQEKPIRRRVALKIIKLGMDTRDVVARFEQERQALALMDHPSIAKVLDAGSTPTGRPFFVMELVHGIKITDYCDEAQLPTSERLKLFVQVCQAVQHAHQKGIIHRDLKPSNVLVTMHDGVPVPKVIDFGVAKATQQQRFTDLTIYTQFQQMVGTPLYMAPEQAEMSGLDIDTRSDIYSLGVVLYELLTGRTPSDPARLMQAGYDEMRRIIREEEPPKPSTVLSTMAADTRKKVARFRHSEEAKLVSSVQGDLDWIVMKALEKDRSRRYDTAVGLARDIERHLASEPVSARPPSAGYRFRRFIRRNRVLAGASAAVLLALALGLGISTFLFLAEQRQRRMADAATHAAEEQRQLAISNERYGRRLLYAADINLAQQALELGNLSRARMLLDRHRPDVGAEDLRGWEWRLLWKHCRTGGFKVLPRPTGDSFRVSQAAYDGEPGSPYSMSYSHDGRFLAVGYTEGRVELWDARRDRLIEALQSVYTPPADKPYEHVGRVSFSPVENVIAATGDHGQLKIWDIDRGSVKVLIQEFINVRDLAFSADGSLLGVLCNGGDVLVLDVASLEPIFQVAEASAPSNMHFGNIRISPDGEMLYVATGAQETKVACYSITRKEMIWEKPAGYAAAKDALLDLTAMAVSPNGEILATALGFKSSAIQVWNARTGEKLGILEGHSRWVSDLVFSRDGERLISASTDQTVRLWNTDTWREEMEPLRGQGDEVWSVAYSAGRQRLAAGGKNGKVLIWNMERRTLSEGRSSLPSDTVWTCALPDGHLLVAKDGRRLSLVNPSTRRETQLQAPSDKEGWFVAPKYLGVQSSKERFEIFEILTTGLVAVAEAPVAPFKGGRVAFSPGTRMIAWSQDADTIIVTNCNYPEKNAAFQVDAGSNVRLFSAEGDFLLVTAPNDSAVVFDLKTGCRMHSAERYLSPFGLPLKNKYHDHRTLQEWLWIAITSGERFSNKADASPTEWLPAGGLGARALAPDGHTFALSGGSAQVSLYDARGARKLFTLRGRSNTTYAMAFSPDGARLAAPGNVLWDMVTLQELMSLPPSGTHGRSAEWTDDGSTLISGAPGVPGSHHFWYAPSWEEIERAERNGVLWATEEE